MKTVNIHNTLALLDPRPNLLAEHLLVPSEYIKQLSNHYYLANGQEYLVVNDRTANYLAAVALHSRRGRILATYDATEIKLGFDFYAYRTN